MRITRTISIAVAFLAVMLAGLAGLAAWMHQAGSQQQGKSARTGNVAVAGARGLDPQGVGCQGQAIIGEEAIERSGQALAVRQELGTGLKAQLNTPVGELVLIRAAEIRPAAAGQPAQSAQVSVAGADAASQMFSAMTPVYAQSSVPALHSCDMMLSDRPAAQPLISAAEQAAVSHDLVASASDLQSKLQEVLISDNPADPGSVIVTLLEQGPVHPSSAQNAPPLHSLQPLTVILTYPGGQFVSAANGGL